MRKLAFPTFAIALLGLVVLLSGCDPYRKLAKSKKIADKDSAAVHYYKAEKYDRAVYLFEELIPIYRGTQRMEEMYYYYAYCRYFLGELVSASYYFGDFAKKFPNSKHAEEFEYMTAKSLYLLSDPWYLDQKYTYKAIDQFQLFLSRYPYSEKKDKCMKAIQELRERLAKKAFEQAMLYHKIGQYKAAVEAFRVMNNEFPDSDFREESQFLLYKSAVLLAEKSIAAKKLKRYEEARDFGEKFVEKFPSSKFAKDAENLSASVDKNEKKLKEEAAQREEQNRFSEFRRSMDVVLNSKDEEEKKRAYEKAQKLYAKFKKDYPESEYLAEADSLFKDLEKIRDKEQ